MNMINKQLKNKIRLWKNMVKFQVLKKFIKDAMRNL